MKGRFQIPSIVFYGVVALMLAICLICFIKALSWVNRPIPGFLMYHPPYVGSMGSRDWSGSAKGLRYLDRIIEVDGQPVRTGKDVLDAARQMKPGTPMRYTAEVKGKILEVTVPVNSFSWKDFFLVFLAPFLGGLILYGLGFVVWRQSIDSQLQILNIAPIVRLCLFTSWRYSS